MNTTQTQLFAFTFVSAFYGQLELEAYFYMNRALVLLLR